MARFIKTPAAAKELLIRVSPDDVTEIDAPPLHAEVEKLSRWFLEVRH